MFGFLKKWLCKESEDRDILQHIAKYCKENPQIDVLNKISETCSLSAMREKGRLDDMQKSALTLALKYWSEGKKTPKEFKGLFRGGR